MLAGDHLTGLTVKDAYGDAASTSNCLSESSLFPKSAIGDSITEGEQLLDTEQFSLDHRIVAFTACIDAQRGEQLEGLQFELAVTNATTGEQSKNM